MLGRAERFDPLHAALLNGIGSHVHEYDDTLPKNYIHPSVPVASALFAYASANPVSGRDFVHAFILGFEVESRIGNAVYPAHYTAGWHITSTTGVFGAAAAIGKLLGLTHEADGLGVRPRGDASRRHPRDVRLDGEVVSTRAAPRRTATRLRCSARPISRPASARSRARAASRRCTAAQYDLGKITAGLGKDFELRDNAYKPYACGLVVHPTIDGCSQLHREHHPVARLDRRRAAARGAARARSVQQERAHSARSRASTRSITRAAIGLVRGKGGLQEFTDEAIADPALQRVRAVTTAVGDADDHGGPGRTSRSILRNGQTLTKFVEQSLGNVHRPLSNEQLTEKFVDQAVLALPRHQVDAVVEQCWRIDALADAGDAGARHGAAHGRRAAVRPHDALTPCAPLAASLGLALLAATLVLAAGCGGRPASSPRCAFRSAPAASASCRCS